MEQNALRRQLWEEAGKAGLALGLVSTAYLFLNQFLSGLQEASFLTGLLSLVLWAGKFGGCIWLMMLFMKKVIRIDTEADNSTTFRFGILAATLSAIVYSAAAFANVSFISADTIVEQTDLMIQQMAPMMDSNSLAQIDKVMEKLPQITFFSNLIYCFFYGTILSFIISRYIPSRNPFANNTSEEW